jgi:hypothetical protein
VEIYINWITAINLNNFHIEREKDRGIKILKISAVLYLSSYTVVFILLFTVREENHRIFILFFSNKNAQRPFTEEQYIP